MSNYINHAMREFRAAGWTNQDGSFKDEMQEMICNHVLKLLDVFADEGHSGSSALPKSKCWACQLLKTLNMSRKRSKNISELKNEIFFL